MPRTSFEPRRIVDVDVRDLMIGDRERGAGPGIEHLVPQLFAERDQSMLPQHAVQMNRLVTSRMPYSDSTMTWAPADS